MKAGTVSQARKGQHSSRLLAGVSVSALILLGLPLTGHAADRYWDANGTAVGSGGNGTWNLGNLNWSPSSDGVSGPYSTPWSNGAVDNAIFGGTAGTVTLGSGVTVHNLTFGLSGYTLTGNTLTLAGAAPTITTSHGVSSTTTIASTIAGTSGLTKAGTGTLQLSGSNTFTGGIWLNGGRLRADSDAALGNLSNNIITAAGATVRLWIDGAGTARSVAIGDGGTVFIEGTGAGSALISGNGNVSVAANDATLSNDANTYTGRTTFAGCNGVCEFYFTSIADLGEASALGAPTTVIDGTIVFNQSSQYSDSIIYIGDGDSSNRDWSLIGEGALLRNQGTGTLTLTGDINVTVGGGFFAEDADIDLQGVLSGGRFTFNASSGRVISLAGANTFSGDVIVTGLVQAAALADAGLASSLGTGSSVALTAGLLSYTGAGASSNRAWSVNGISSILNDGSGALALSGNLAFDPATPTGDSLTLGGSFTGTNTFSGVISGTGSLISEGQGTWVLSGANTFVGPVTVNGGVLRAGNASAFGSAKQFVINAGTLDLGGYDLTATSLTGTGGTVALGSMTLTVNATTAQSYGGVISGSGGLTKTGAGTLALSGANTFTGATTISGGTLALDFTGTGAPEDNILAASSPLVLSGGTLAVTGADSVANSQDFAGLTVAAGSNTVRATSGAGGSIALNLGAISRTGGLANFVLPESGAITTTNADGVLGGWATINGSDYAKVVGGNIVAFAATDYTDKDQASTWAAGEIISDAGNAADTPFEGTVGSSVQLGGLRYTAAADSTVTVGSGATLGIEGTIIIAPSTGTANQLITGGALTGSVGGGSLGFQHNGAGTFEAASTIVDNGGAISVVKGGTGIVRLSGDNTYTGATVLTGGTLRVTSIANGGVASSIGASTAASSNLVLESGTFQYTGSTVTTDRGFTLVNGGPSRVIEVIGGTNLTFNGVVESPDNAGFTKLNAGTLTLGHAANSFIGVTNIFGGTLSVGTVANGGVVSALGAATSESANLVFDNGATLQYTGGNVTIDRGFTLNAGNGGGIIDVASAATTLTVNGIATGGGAFGKTGVGTLVLGGNNTYTGQTTVAAGTLRAGSATAFGTGSLSVSSGATLDLGGFDITATTLLGEGTVVLGANTLTSTGATGVFSGHITGTGGFTRGSGSTTQSLTGCTSDYTGATTIQGSLSVACINDGGEASSIGASGAASSNLIVNGTLTYTGGNATTDRGFTTGTNAYLGVSTASTTLEFQGAVVGSGHLFKDGAGTLVLSGANTYAGNTFVRGGTLRAGSSQAFGASAAMTLSNVAGVTLDLAGFEASVSYLNGGGADGGVISLGSGTLTITTGNNASDVAYAGVITGTGNIVKAGTATQRISGCSNDYSGTTTINGGSLEVTCLTDGGAASSIGQSSAAASNLILNGGVLRYAGAGGSTDRQFTLGTATGSGLDASGTGAIEFTSTNPITFSGTNAAQTLTLTGTNTGSNSFAAQIINNGTGQTALTKTGTGTWLLTNSGSTYTGITTISGGVLGVDKLADGGVASSLGASSAAASNLVIGNGSTLRYTGSGDTTNRLFTLAAGVTYLESSGTGAIVFTDTGPVTLQGNNQARTIALGGTNTGNNTLAGSIGNAGTGLTTLAKNDSGTWVLTGNHSYTGSTNINGGTLVIGGGGTTGSIASSIVNNSATLAFDRSDSLSYSGQILGSGAVNQVGTGTTILTGDNSYLGATTVSAGTLRINGDQTAATGLTSVLSGGTLGGSGIIGGSVLVADGGKLAPGNSPGTLTINGNLTLNNASILDLEFGQANVVGGPLNDLIVVGGDLTLDGTVNVVASPDGSFGPGLYRVINYGGTLTNNELAIGTLPAGAEVFVQTSIANQVNLVNTAGLTLNYWDGEAGPAFNGQVNGGNGTWQSGGTKANWTDVDGSVNVPYLTNSFAIFSATPGTVTVDDSLGAVTAAGMQFASDGYEITGDALTLSGPQSTIRVGDGTTAGADYTATITSQLSGATELVKTDLGTLVLGGVNLYTGGTAINAGTLQISSDANLGDTAGGITLDGGTLRTTATISTARAVTLVSSGTFLTDAATSLTLTSAVSGGGALAKDGAGTLVLTADALYTGGTTITAGTLQLGNGGSTGSILGDVVNNGTLAFNRLDALTFSGVISGTGAVHQNGADTLILTADSSYTGGTTIAAGTLQLGNGGSTGSIVGNVLNNAALVFNRTGEVTFAGTISGTGSLTHAGAGTTILTGPNSYAGTTDVNAGILLVNGNQSAAQGLTSVASGATLGGTGIIGGTVAVADGGILAPGSNGIGTLSINGDLTLAATSLLDYEFGQSNVVGGPLNDLIEVGGDLTLDGTIDVTLAPGGSFDVGLYRVVSYGGTLTDNGLTIGALPNGSTAFVQTSIANQVNLVNTSGLTLNFWDGAAGPKFDGAVNGGDGIWQDSGGNDNWADVDGLVNAAYSDDAFAIFSSAPGVVTVDNSLGAVRASGLQFASDGYTIAGDALTLTWAQSTVRVGDGTAAGAGYTATIASEIIGSSQLVKTDLGTLILNADNTYTGGTAVNVGTLLINGDQSAATGDVTVGTAVLGGSGTIGGDVIVSGGTLSPGSNGVGTLTINGSLTLDANSALSMEFGEAGVVGGALNDLITVGGDLVLDGTLNVTVPAGGAFEAGVYRVLNYTGALTDNGLELGTLPSGSSAAIQTSINGQVNLINAGGLYLTFWDGNGPKFDGVINGGDGVWQSGAGNNSWTNDTGAINAPYQDTGFAVFAGAPGTVTVDNSLGQVLASGMQFASGGYVISGGQVTLVGNEAIIRVGDGTTAGSAFVATIASELAGTSQLVKTDEGTLILTGENSYTGGTAIHGGTLQIALDSALGDAAGNVSLNGGALATTASLTSARAFDVSGPGTLRTGEDTTLTLTGAISGAGTLTKEGLGNLVLTGDSAAFAGGTLLKAGTLTVNGTLGGTLDVLTGGRLQGTGQTGPATLRSGGVIAPGNGIGTLTIAGNYVGEGGLLEIEAELGSDASVADRLVITGASLGVTNVKVFNVGGEGAPTVGGVKIIDVLGQSGGQFNLLGDYVFQGQQAVVAGAYAYTLQQGGVSTPDDGDWYLRSDALNPAGPVNPTPPAPVEPGAPAPAPIWQPGVPVYEAYAQTLQALNGLPTLQQRVGNRRWAPGSVTDGSGVWGRIESVRDRGNARISTSQTDHGVNLWKMQLGLDRVLANTGDNGVLVGGLVAHYGRADASVQSIFGNGQIDTDGYGVGATLTWYGPEGFYADGQAQIGWTDSDLDSGPLGRLVKNNRGQGEAFSLELGKRTVVSETLSLTPQLQMVYGHSHFDRFIDPKGANVSLRHAESLKTRWGVSLDHQAGWESNGQTRRSHVYGLVNVSFEWLNGTEVQVSGMPIHNAGQRWWGELGLGGSLTLSNRLTVYGEASGTTALGDLGKSHALKGSVGMRLSF